MSFPGVKAVDHVSLTVEPGEFFTLLGPSGCGKTTLLRTIAGFYRQTGGSIYFNDKCVDGTPAYRRNTGMVFQNYAIFPHLTVWKNVAYGLKARRLPKEEMHERVREALELVDLKGYEERRPSQLSGGQQQRVVLARAFVIHPAVLLMDEPLANLDAKLRVRLRRDLRELQQQLGLTTVYVTHDQDEALSLSDRVAVMFDGRVHHLGTPGEIYQEGATQRVADFIGEMNILPGTVTSLEKGTVTVSVSDVLDLAVPVRPCHDLPSGTAVSVGFRPHDGRIVEKASGDVRGSNTFAGRVVSEMYFGSVTRFTIATTGGYEIMLEAYQSRESSRFAGAEELYLSVATEDLTLFDGETGENLTRRNGTAGTGAPS